MNNHGIQLEICVGSLSDAMNAKVAGADRLELCSALELGGLTPSAGLLADVVAAVDAPVMAMVRPRAGGFCYDNHEYATMLHDAELLVAGGANGIVFGILDSQGKIDVARCREFVAAAGDCETVFHKAFDFTPNLGEALEQLVELGVTRVLTSGGKPTAFEGLDVLAELCRRADGRIEILPGGGLRPTQVSAIAEQTGCNQLHAGASTRCVDASTTNLPNLCPTDLAKLEDGGHRAVDRDLAAKIAQACHQVH